LVAEHTESARLNFIVAHLLGRTLAANESEIVRGSLRSLRNHYGSNRSDALKLVEVGDSRSSQPIECGDLAAWTMVTNELMNLDEVLNK
jgi:hypothetical protein